MPFKKGQSGNPAGSKTGGTGRPPNWFKMSCKEVAARIDLPEFWGSIVISKNEKTSDRMQAAVILAEFGEGKATQTLEVNQHEDHRPTTDSLIETLTALRNELDNLRKGTEVEIGK